MKKSAAESAAERELPLTIGTIVYNLSVQVPSAQSGQEKIRGWIERWRSRSDTRLRSKVSRTISCTKPDRFVALNTPALSASYRPTKQKMVLAIWFTNS